MLFLDTAIASKNTYFTQNSFDYRNLPSPVLKNMFFKYIVEYETYGVSYS